MCGVPTRRKQGLHRLWDAARKKSSAGAGGAGGAAGVGEAVDLADEMGLAHGTAAQWQPEWQALHLFSTFAFEKRKLLPGTVAAAATLPPKAEMATTGQYEFKRQAIHL